MNFLSESRISSIFIFVAITAFIAHYYVYRPRIPTNTYIEFDQELGAGLIMDVTERLVKENTEAGHTLEVIRTNAFGKVLLLDDDLMFTEHDEKRYHEMSAHVPMHYFLSPPYTHEDENISEGNHHGVRILIVGGGDGGVCRELCKYDHVESITIVDIDPRVTSVTLEHFPSIAGKCFADKRTRIHHMDAAKFVSDRLQHKRETIKNNQHDEFLDDDDVFDLIIVDSTDFNLAESLFTVQFYDELKRLLHRNGILVINLTSLSWNVDGAVDGMQKLKRFYKHVRVFQVFQPTYLSGHYGYLFCSDDVDPYRKRVDRGDNEDVTARFRKMLSTLHYYSIGMHISSFVLPSYLRRALGEEEDMPVAL